MDTKQANFLLPADLLQELRTRVLGASKVTWWRRRFAPSCSGGGSWLHLRKPQGHGRTMTILNWRTASSSTFGDHVTPSGESGSGNGFGAR